MVGGGGAGIAQPLVLMTPIPPNPNLRWPEPLPEDEDGYYSNSDFIPSIIAESVSMYNDTE